MDSVCSAWAYARLKNSLDEVNRYTPVMLGPANRNTRRIFSELSLELPMFLHDVKPRVGQVTPCLSPDGPLRADEAYGGAGDR